MSIKYWLEAVKNLQELSQVYGGDGRVLAGFDAQKQSSQTRLDFLKCSPGASPQLCLEHIRDFKKFSWSCSGCPQH